MLKINTQLLIMKKYCFVSILMILTINQESFAQVELGDFQKSYVEPGSGTIRTYYLYVPEYYDSSESYPLLFSFHGSGQTGGIMRDFMKQTTDIGAIICCPDHNNMTTTQELMYMVDSSFAFLDNYSIDENKRVITGFSFGAYTAYHIGLYNPDMFTGIIGISPLLDSAQMNTRKWENIRSIRMAAILGTADFNWIPANNLLTMMQDSAAKLLYLVKQDVSHSDIFYFNSQEYINDYKHCYNYIIGNTSVNDQDSEQDIVIFPNPFTNGFRIKTPENNTGITTIRLIDIQGKVVYRKGIINQQAGESVVISIDHLKNGTYLLQLTGREFNIVKEVVKISK